MYGLRVLYYVVAWRNDLILLDVDRGWGCLDAMAARMGRNHLLARTGGGADFTSLREGRKCAAAFLCRLGPPATVETTHQYVSEVVVLAPARHLLTSVMHTYNGRIMLLVH